MNDKFGHAEAWVTPEGAQPGVLQSWFEGKQPGPGLHGCKGPHSITNVRPRPLQTLEGSEALGILSHTFPEPRNASNAPKFPAAGCPLGTLCAVRPLRLTLQGMCFHCAISH